MSTVIAAFLNPLLIIAMPLYLGIWLARRLKAEWRPFGLGMLTFIGSQVLHIPFNAWALSPLIRGLQLNSNPGTLSLAVVSVLLGLSAGVFEESARYLVYHRWLPKPRSPVCAGRCGWRDGLMFGAGHGGAEAILVGILVFYSFLQLMALRNVDLTTVLKAEQLESTRIVLQNYWSLPWYAHLIPALERAGAICVQLSLSLLVLQAFSRRNGAWFGLAILWHAIVDAVAVFAVQTWGMYVAEGLVVLSALLSIGIIFALRGHEEAKSQAEIELPIQPLLLPHIEPKAEELDRDKLDESRYHEGS